MRIVKSSSYFHVEVSVNGNIRTYALNTKEDVEHLLSGEAVLDTHDVEVVIPINNFTVVDIREITEYNEVWD